LESYRQLAVRLFPTDLPPGVDPDKALVPIPNIPAAARSTAWMIPTAEADLLMNTVTDAIEKVAEGRLGGRNDQARRRLREGERETSWERGGEVDGRQQLKDMNCLVCSQVRGSYD
jgi:hypothetical protein